MSGGELKHTRELRIAIEKRRSLREACRTQADLIVDDALVRMADVSPEVVAKTFDMAASELQVLSKKLLNRGDV